MFDIVRFKHLARMTEETLENILPEVLQAYGYKTVKHSVGNYVYAVGDIDVGLVAHIDTVFSRPPSDIYHDPEAKVLWSPDGLGADDRAGVAAILEILDKGLRPWVFFCCEEEVGGTGARKLSLSIKPNLRYLIEIDRQGEKDCVFYNCDNKEFIKYIESAGFEESWGTFSDISFLAPAWRIAATNVSTGYYDEHSKCEILNYEHLERTIERIITLLRDDDKRYFKYVRLQNKRCEICGSPSGLVKTYFLAPNESINSCIRCYEDFLKEAVI